jgi:hypothetical protein
MEDEIPEIVRRRNARKKHKGIDQTQLLENHSGCSRNCCLRGRLWDTGGL